jgi:hypothetical protein
MSACLELNGAVAHVVVGRPAVVSAQRTFVAKPFASRSAEATTREKMPPIGYPTLFTLPAAVITPDPPPRLRMTSLFVPTFPPISQERLRRVMAWKVLCTSTPIIPRPRFTKREPGIRSTAQPSG